ncbi:ATP-dependent DNA helicase PIF1-like [Senna tora]|uniref:ATP-dependent DNA helicase n=1 Tax=Senna tora TaxID=362788 RepID=A0A834X1B1_9FABA|nr:ATP-dependent DNA helicase PIF1-like [Senna tora]
MGLLSNMDNMLMSEELNYDKQLLRLEHSTLLASLTSEQATINHLVVDAVNQQIGGVFFVNGFDGSEKTFIWNTLTSALRSRGDILLAVASNDIASQLIPGGRIAHSRFAIPLDCNENSTCNIMQGSDMGNLLIHTRDICGKKNPEAQNIPFGGKVVVFGGNFKQILPNTRLGTCANEFENRSISEFADWILKIGDGNIGDVINDEEKEIRIPNNILLQNGIDPIHWIVNSSYPSFTENYLIHEYIRDRVILAPTLDDVA